MGGVGGERMGSAGGETKSICGNSVVDNSTSRQEPNFLARQTRLSKITNTIERDYGLG